MDRLIFRWILVDHGYLGCRKISVANSIHSDPLHTSNNLIMNRQPQFEEFQFDLEDVKPVVPDPQLRFLQAMQD